MRNLTAWLVLLIVSSALGLSTQADALTSVGRPSTPNTVIDMPIQINDASTDPRWHRVVCNWVCDGWQYVRTRIVGVPDPRDLVLDLLGISLRQCVSWKEDCGRQASYAGLYANFHDMGAANEFQSSNWHNVGCRRVVVGGYVGLLCPPGTPRYEGCGPAAIRNVLTFYGVNTLSEADIRRRITTVRVPVVSDDIATAPAELESELSGFLNDYAYGRYHVRRISGARHSRIRAELSQGNVVIAMVKDGTHYVVVTGFEERKGAYEYHVIDYGGQDRWVKEANLDLSISNIGRRFVSGLSRLFDEGKYLSGTLIIVKQSVECNGRWSEAIPCPANRPYGIGGVKGCANGKRFINTGDCYPQGRHAP